MFQTNFAFGRAVRLQAQNVHPGYWQSAHPDEDGYRPDQIMRYSEGNLNRLQIVGELHVKSGKVLEAEKAPELDAPLELALLTTEASWENRGQMSRTSARDFVEALLLDVHHAQYLQAHPHVAVKDSLLQDQILGDAEETLKRHGGATTLARLHREARELNLEASRGRMNTDWIEPETLFWAAWRVLPAGEKAALAREAIGGFLERVEQAAAMDPRPEAAERPDGVASPSHSSVAVGSAGKRRTGRRGYRPAAKGTGGLAGAQRRVSGTPAEVVAGERRGPAVGLRLTTFVSARRKLPATWRER